MMMFNYDQYSVVDKVKCQGKQRGKFGAIASISLKNHELSYVNVNLIF